MLDPWVLALAAIVLLLVYGLVCRFWPYTACWRCDGDGKLRSPSGKKWRKCPRCKGNGWRLRVGRHVLNALFRTRDRANRAE